MERLISHYRLLHPLGEGGMGEVYAGIDETLKRRVAMKAIRAEHQLSPLTKARFLREARVLSQLDHPNICRVYDFIEDGDSEWLVMELIEGKSLQAALRVGLDPASRLRIAEQIASVLVATHTAGIVHRDLKPGNIMLTRGHEVKVLDFGLAQSRQSDSRAFAPESSAGTAAAPPTEDPLLTISSAPDDAALVTGSLYVRTEGGAITGTPAYMSPEQARGEPAAAPSDMYSFGLMLQELYTGHAPYPRGISFPELIERAQRAETLPPTGVPAEIAALIGRLKQPAPAQRPTAVETEARLAWIRQRPKRLARNGLVAAVALAALLGAAKYTMDLARERTLAVAARQEADSRRAQAEDLIDFMLGDLRKRLEPVGRLEILDEVGVKAMGYFAAVPASALSDEELLRRSAALYQIGDVRIAQGDLGAATAPLKESLALAQALAARQPNDGDRLFGLAQSHYWVGFVHWRRHDLAAAEREFQSYLDVAQRLVALDAGRPAWRREVAYANSNLGSVQEARGDLAAALERYRATLAIERALLATTPGDRELQSSAAASHNLIAVVLRSSGRFADALRELAQELEIRNALLTAEPANFTFRLRLSVAHSHIGHVLAAQGVMPEAIAAYGRAATLLGELGIRDSGNRSWQREIAAGHFSLGTARLAAGQTEAALPLLRRAAEMIQPISDGDPTNAGWRRDLADYRRALGEALLAHLDTDAAARQAEAAIEITDDLIGRPGNDRHAARIGSTAHALLARALTSRGDVDRARTHWERAYALVAPAAADSRDYRFLAPLAVALLQLERTVEAAPVLEILTTIGYRNPTFVRQVQTNGQRLLPRAHHQEGQRR